MDFACTVARQFAKPPDRTALSDPEFEPMLVLRNTVVLRLPDKRPVALQTMKSLFV